MTGLRNLLLLETANNNDLIENILQRRCVRDVGSGHRASYLPYLQLERCSNRYGRELMKALCLFLICVTGTLFAAQSLAAQAPQTDPNITPSRVVGEVKAIDAAAKQLTVKTDAGSEVTVIL